MIDVSGVPYLLPFIDCTDSSIFTKHDESHRANNQHC
jgi:hypothetical protein